MKVLFAVSNEEVSEGIVKKYQNLYKQIISYKNVYYFNAILKELQKDKTYDRIVISEDLEAFTHTQYDQIDKFIFEKLDSISDEASNSRGNDTPIILICSDRRTKGEQILVKMFGIGVYNAIIGNDRSTEEVCRLINRPRTKKEAKIYYNIDSDNVSYEPENENDVSEMEIQNILAHYKRLGKDEERYVESFNNIVAQYNDTQLRIISKFLPLNVRAVLEERSPKYQQIMSFNNSVTDNLRTNKKKKEEGTSEILLKTKNKETIMSKPVVIPTAVNMSGVKKLSKSKKVDETIQKHKIEEPIKEQPKIENENIETQKDEEVKEVKKGRGRPRKTPVAQTEVETIEPAPKRGRGRPRKNTNTEETIKEQVSEQQEPVILPGFEEEQEEAETNNILPGFEEIYDNEEPKEEKQDVAEQIPIPESEENINTQEDYNIYEEEIDLSRLLTADKKIVTFVGTSKNGTSFIVNNLAEQMSSIGINTVILDTTKNKNSYYIYTKNEETLRQVASKSIDGLAVGITNGIKANKNLTVYTSLPNQDEAIKNVDKILETLLKNYSLILIDTDFETPKEYFKYSQETYLVQSMDILTIQPLTAFLKDLKAKNILDESKLKVVLNKVVKIRGIKNETIVGGLAFYNDPSMSFMTELFDKDRMKYIAIPFEDETYIKYLEGIIKCDVSLKGYSKAFLQSLKELGNMVYPIVGAGGVSTKVKKEKNVNQPSIGIGNFSPTMNSTLDKMKKRY